MVTREELDSKITAINEMFIDYIDYIDSISFTDENEKVYVTSETLISNTHKSVYSSVQSLEEQKKDSLLEYELTTKSDTTLFNLCFEIYTVVTDDLFDKLITANDLQAYNRTDIDPNDPIIRKGTKIIYYK
jgi:hypothetical protein